MPFKMTDLIQSELDDEQINANFSLDILKGLSEFPKRIPSKYFYDDQGSEYFKKIMESQDYYLTNLEQEILDQYSPELPLFFSEKKLNIVDLGAGDGSKSMTLIKAFQKKDICTYCFNIYKDRFNSDIDQKDFSIKTFQKEFAELKIFKKI